MLVMLSMLLVRKGSSVCDVVGACIRPPWPAGHVIVGVCVGWNIVCEYIHHLYKFHIN